MTARDTLDERVKAAYKVVQMIIFASLLLLAEVAADASYKPLFVVVMGYHHSVIEQAGVRLDLNQRSVWLNNQPISLTSKP